MHFQTEDKGNFLASHLAPERKINMEINMITNGSLKRI